MIGETFLKGIFYFLLKAKGGKYISRKQVAGKDGKNKWVYTYAKTGSKKTTKEPKPKADKKGMDTKKQPKEKGNAFSSLSKDELSDFISTPKKMKQSETSDKIKADGKELESLYDKHEELNKVISGGIEGYNSHKRIQRLIEESKKGELSKDDAKELKNWSKQLSSMVKDKQKRYDKAKKESGQ